MILERYFVVQAERVTTRITDIVQVIGDFAERVHRRVESISVLKTLQDTES